MRRRRRAGRQEKKMIIAVASDHGGFALKNVVKDHLLEKGIEVADMGTYNEDSVDYPEFGKKCAEEVASGKADKGIVCCGTGIGISIAANKVKGIRAAVCTNEMLAEMTRRHNNANVICMGQNVVSPELANRMTDIFISTEFEGGRHERRVNLLADIENGKEI